jgi:uncharacterized LabA/DUF88 family protein
MATRGMLFVDGTWTGVQAVRLGELRGTTRRPGGPVDFGALPRVCASRIAAQMDVSASIDLVRSYYFGAIATNYDPQDEDAVQRRRDFHDALRREHRYQVVRFETDYRGRRVRRADRAEDDAFEPREKAVDVALATTMLEMAALSAYDIAIVVCGDRDFLPALQAVRRLGKRVALVSARGACPREYSDPDDAQHVRDFNTIWLDDIWPEIEAHQERAMERPIERPVIRPIERETPRASSRTVSVALPYDDWADPFGPPQVMPNTPEPTSSPLVGPNSTTARNLGVVIKVHPKQYAFVRGDDGQDYFFHRKAMANPEAFPALLEQRSRVSFLVDAMPSSMQAGRGGHVELLAEHHE